MQVITSIRKMQEKSLQLKRKNKTIGFIPTMGALHDGHLSLVRAARRDNDYVVLSIFVNPIQFGPKEDFKKYPRPFTRDIHLCSREKVDFVFYPKVTDMYPEGFKTFIEVEKLGDTMCALSRPGHFKGVATVVAKLFNAVLPDNAYFGQKDAQQAAVIKRMARDLNFPLKIKIMPIIRENDGLAMSSRNSYLDNKERQEAVVLYQALNKARELIKSGCLDSAKIQAVIENKINEAPSAKLEYIAIVNADTLEPVPQVKENTLIALAVWVGQTRLIDNIVIFSLGKLGLKA